MTDWQWFFIDILQAFAAGVLVGGTYGLMCVGLGIIFGVGFFIYVVGGTIDRLFFPEALPTPTFGTGGILWASLTLAILTIPVVIVATEEGLAAIPRGMREASLALGAPGAWIFAAAMAAVMLLHRLVFEARAAGGPR